MSSYICLVGQIFVSPQQPTGQKTPIEHHPQAHKTTKTMEDLPSQEKNRSTSYFKKKGTRMMVRERAASEQSKTIWYGCTVLQILRAVCLTVQFDVHDACTISSVQNLSKIVTPRIQISCRQPKHHRSMASRRATKRPNKALANAEIALPPESTIIPQPPK